MNGVPNTLPSTVPPPIALGDPSLLLWIFFWAGLILSVGFALALYYHWLRYSYMYPMVWVAMPVYGIGFLILMGAMLGAIASI